MTKDDFIDYLKYTYIQELKEQKAEHAPWETWYAT